MPSSRFSLLRQEGDPLASRLQDNINTVLQPLAKNLNATPIMGAPPPPWIKPDLQGDLANAGGGFATAGYHKDALGYVHVKAVLQTAAGLASGATLFVLLMGFRPSEILRVPDASGVAQSYDVNPDGRITASSAIAGPAFPQLLFDFLAEQ